MIYSERYLPQIEDYTSNGDLSVEAIMRIFENTGSHHSDSVGDGLINGTVKGTAWILTEWHIEILKRPKNGDIINASTWAVSIPRPGMITSRSYMIKDPNGNIYAQGSARLVLMDTNTGKIMRITSELIDKYAPEEKDIFGDSVFRINKPESYEYEKEIAIRRTDIDFNHHVHNICYLSYALDTIPEDVFEKDEFTKVDVVYKKPIKACKSAICKYTAEENKHTVGIFSGAGELNSLVVLTV